MKKAILCVFTACMMFLCGCSFTETVKSMTVETSKVSVMLWFEDHKADMENVIASNSPNVKTDWCKGYNIYSNGEYEFIYQHITIEGLNHKYGIVYIINNTPNYNYVQDESNPDLYYSRPNDNDEYLLERIESNWFYFFDKYYTE